MSRGFLRAWVFALAAAMAFILAYPAGASVERSATRSADCGLGSDLPARCGYDIDASRTTHASALYRADTRAYDRGYNLTQPRMRAFAPILAAKGAGGLGDLTPAEIRQIQGVVDRAGRPLEVVGSAARGHRRGVGSSLSIGKGARPCCRRWML